MFTHSNNFVAEFNINDYAISKYFEKKEDNIIYVRSGKSEDASIFIAEMLCEGVSKEMIKFKSDYLNNADYIEYFFADFYKLRHSLIGPFHQIVLQSGILNN
jgi:hypothetical protein